MAETTYTPGPWIMGEVQEMSPYPKYGSLPLRPISLANHEGIAWVGDSEVDKNNAERIIACVNALEGVGDPVAEIARLRALEKVATLIADPTSSFHSGGINMQDVFDALHAALRGQSALADGAPPIREDFVADEE